MLYRFYRNRRVLDKSFIIARTNALDMKCADIDDRRSLWIIDNRYRYCSHDVVACGITLQNIMHIAKQQYH